jgi:hypothetical protein
MRCLVIIQPEERTNSSPETSVCLVIIDPEERTNSSPETSVY